MFVHTHSKQHAHLYTLCAHPYPKAAWMSNWAFLLYFLSNILYTHNVSGSLCLHLPPLLSKLMCMFKDHTMYVLYLCNMLDVQNAACMKT